MLILVILALTLSISNSPALLKNTSALSGTYQQKCLQQMPTDSKTATAIQSLLCGEKITDAKLKTDLMKSSVIHIFVVSGSHLILLDQVLSIFRIPLFLRFLLLGFYSLIVGWQPPAVRALGALLMRTGLRHYRIYFPGDLLVLACGLLAPALFPGWWTSMSFQMSWCAALALSFPSVVGIRSASWRGALISQGMIYLLMLPVLWGWGSLHPLGILNNLLLAPVVALVLLPLAFLALFHSSMMFIFGKVFSVFEVLLQAVSEPVLIPQGQATNGFLLWVWILSLHGVFHFLRLYLKQGQDTQ
jgi:competence protein ComEC